VAAGRLTHDEAMRSRNAHAITRTLGGPDGPDPPEVRAFDLPAGPILLLLCTDGLWAAFPDPAGLARTAWQLAARGDALAVARGLVDAANERHGRDNATAAVLILDTGTRGGSPEDVVAWGHSGRSRSRLAKGPASRERERPE